MLLITQNKVDVYVAQESKGLYQTLEYMTSEGIIDNKKLNYLGVENPFEYGKGIPFPEKSSLSQNLQIKGIPLILNGSGSIHHSTYLFVRDMPSDNEFSLLLIDKHPDGVENFPRNRIHRGGFISDIVYDVENVRNAVWFDYDGGLIIESLKTGGIPKTNMDITKKKDVSVLQDYLSDDVYISLDLDCLSEEYVQTDWDQGDMTLDELITILDGVGKEHRIIGADICGLSSKGVNQKSIESYVKIYKKFQKIMG